MAESLLTDLDDSPASIPSGTVTFLFTDIQGSTQLLERLREQYALVLAEQRDVLRAIFAEWNGHEIDTQGDVRLRVTRDGIGRIEIRDIERCRPIVPGAAREDILPPPVGRDRKRYPVGKRCTDLIIDRSRCTDRRRGTGLERYRGRYRCALP